MIKVDTNRVTDPIVLSTAEIVEAVEKHGHLVVQFSKSGTYPPTSLHALNEACGLVGERIQVRFYGHYGAAFDAGTLRNLPEVRDLAVDCLADIVNENEIGQLPNLQALHFGVFGMNRPDFLTTIDLGRLKQLNLNENRKRNIDLSPLAAAGLLEELFVEGHSKGIRSIAKIPGLNRLTLRAYAKSNPLDFIASLPSLKNLKLVLGGREDIDDLSSASLTRLQILRVRGLGTLGDLSRLPELSELRVEDQSQLGCLDLGGANLERLWLFNCKTLAELPGLASQHRLKEFLASGVRLDLNDLRDRDWPSATRSVQLYSNSRRWNDDADASLAARGLSAESEPWL
jgi:hypothetical protein